MLSTTASRLLHLTSTEPSVTITAISFASQNSTSASRCRTQAILTLAGLSPSTWEWLNRRTDKPSLPIGKEGSSEVCLPIQELGDLLFLCVELELKFGSALRDLISDWTTSTPIRAIGSVETAYSLMLYSGANTSIEISLQPLGLIELLQFWMTCLKWSIKPEDWGLEIGLSQRDLTDLYTSGTSLTTGISPSAHALGWKVWKMLERPW